MAGHAAGHYSGAAQRIAEANDETGLRKGRRDTGAEPLWEWAGACERDVGTGAADCLLEHREYVVGARSGGAAANGSAGSLGRDANEAVAAGSDRKRAARHDRRDCRACGGLLGI